MGAPEPEPLIGALEGGGTKFQCAVADLRGVIRAQQRIATRAPQDTLRDVIAFFRAHGGVTRLGVGCFGPLDLNPQSPGFGVITSAAKPGWVNAPLLEALERGVGVPVLLLTDVQAAALGERWVGAAQDVDRFVYVTVGTGIGCAVSSRADLLSDGVHAEYGHILPARAPGDAFAGVCPYHGACLEGLASGPAIAARTGMAGDTLSDDHPVFATIAHYLAQLSMIVSLAAAPERIVFGGGVGGRPALMDQTRPLYTQLMNGFAAPEAAQHALERFIQVSAAQPASAGLMGAIRMALEGVGYGRQAVAPLASA